LVIARELGQLPDVVESEMSEYWINRMVVILEAEAIRHQNEQKKR
jgi:hypothetical protein